MANCLLKLKNLSIDLQTPLGDARIVRNVDLEVNTGEIVGLVGESGCGKTTISRSILGLLSSGIRVSKGEINYKQKDLLSLSKKEIQGIRGKEIAMIFQDSMTSLNPVRTIGKQFVETICNHMKVEKSEAKRKTKEMLMKVNLNYPERIMKCYPFQLSGGMMQRVMIAMALVLKSKVLIADEPTTALDVTIQAQILNEMVLLKEKYGMSILLVSHNLGIISRMADKVAVMYAGSIVEYGYSDEIFKNPKHPYTNALLLSVPRMDIEQKRLISIKGQPPSLFNMPSGCAYHPRCKIAADICKVKKPVIKETLGGNKVACHFVRGVDNMEDRNYA